MTRAAGTGVRAALLSIGDELLSGRTQDQNAAWLAARLLELDVVTDRIVVVGDEETVLAEAIAELAREHDLVLSTGGLGPTPDDVTRHAAARAANVALEESPEARGQIEAWYALRPVPMPASNLRQALLPAGAEVLPNDRGTAPGFGLPIGAATFFALPGPPSEMHAMYERQVLPRLAVALPPRVPLLRASFSLFGLSESVFAERAAEWLVRGDNPEMGVTVSGGILTALMTAGGAEAERVLLARSEAFRTRFAEYLFSEQGESLELALARAAATAEASAPSQVGLRLAFAESCTGGLATAMLTRVPGVSTVLLGGFVTYSDEAKQRELGVPAELLRAHGAVSNHVAAAMAAGAAERLGADVAVSITGIAGPGGAVEPSPGDPDATGKPVGLVWFGVSDRGRVETHERRFPPGDRDRIREWAACTALFLALRCCQGAGPALRG